MAVPTVEDRLSEAQVEDFGREGYVSPIPVFDGEEVAELRGQFEAFEARLGPQTSLARRTDLHLVQKWAWDVVNDPRIVGPVTQLLGPNVLLWSLNWFIKEAADGKYVSFHQDATYWGLEPHDVLTAWVALSAADIETGPMRFVPGSHRGDMQQHMDTFESDNLLSRGQEIVSQFDSRTAVAAPLHPGEMSLHHVRTIHGSEPNQTDDRRIGMVMRYAATNVTQTKLRDTAVLVAGEDTFGNFDLLEAPRVEFGEAEMARQSDALERMSRAIHSMGPPPKTR